MAQTPRSDKDRGKALAFIPSRGDSSSSNESTVSASGQVACTLRGHYDKGEDDIMPRVGIDIRACT